MFPLLCCALIIYSNTVFAVLKAVVHWCALMADAGIQRSIWLMTSIDKAFMYSGPQNLVKETTS